MRQSRRALMLALAGVTLITLVLLGERLGSSEAMHAAADRHAQAYRLAADVRATQDQLTAAARMAAVTGDPAWIDRFDRLVPELARSIEHLALLAPPEAAQRYENQTREVAATLARMHRSALEAMGSGGVEAARGLLESKRYRETSGSVREATEALTAASLAATAARVAELRERTYYLAAGVGLVALGLGLTLWRRLSRNLSRSRGSLLDAEERIQRLAASDLLTGLDNRAALHDAMQQLMARARRHEQTLAVLMVDLDRFKPVNDRHGHMVGDMVLKEVARRLGRCVRQGDLLARYGGDEFVIVVEETGGVNTAVAAAESIIDRMSQPIPFGDLVVSVGASVGVARFPFDAGSDDELLRKADSALYRAKQAGRGGVCLYDARLDERLSERHALEQELREAIASGQLVPHYQPIVDLAQRSVRSLELLCRWRHPVRGMLAPDTFIKLAEESNLIGPLTINLLDQACRDLTRFPTTWRLSFNVAPQQIQDESLVPQLLQVLAAHAVPPSRIDVELTETALVNDTARARSVILALKRAGMTVTLDDFGKGYSSLSYLAEMTFDKIKIDASFVRTLHESPKSAKIVSAIIGLSRSLGVHNVAEGVETEEQARALQKLGCTFAQGYLFGRPVRAAELADRAALAKDVILLPTD